MNLKKLLKRKEPVVLDNESYNELLGKVELVQGCESTHHSHQTKARIKLGEKVKNGLPRRT